MFDPFDDGESVYGTDDDGNENVRIKINAGDPEIDHLELMLPGPQRQRKKITLEQLRGMI